MRSSYTISNSKHLEHDLILEVIKIQFKAGF